MSRLESLTSQFSSLRIQALLVTNIFNVRYLLAQPSLFDENFGGGLLVLPGRAILLIDFRYLELAERAVVGAEIRELTEGRAAALAPLLDEEKVLTLGIEAETMRVSEFQALKKALKIGIRPVSRAVLGLRHIKDAGEVELSRRAAALGDLMFGRLAEVIKPGVSEKDVALEIEVGCRRLGAERVSFEPIVASGPNSAIPHARATDRRIAPGDLVKLDFGCVVDGYCSDMTRMAVAGRATDRQRTMYELVRRAHDAAIEGIRPGFTGARADAIARDLFAVEGVDRQFGHGLGHGTGLEVHEPPTLGPRSKDVLEPGMVFTVEPGLYVPGFGGCRLEDMVLLTDDGCESLSAAPRELVELEGWG